LKDNPVVVMNYGTVKVQISDLSDSTATGANIKLKPKSEKLKQDSIGNYIFDNVKPGNYTVSVSSDDYYADSSQISVYAADTAQVNFFLQHKPVIGVSINSLNFNQLDVGDTSSPMSYNITGNYLEDSLTIKAPDGFYILYNNEYISEIQLAFDNNNNISDTVYIVFSPSEVKSYNGSLRHTSLHAADVVIQCFGDGLCNLNINPNTLNSFPQEGRSDSIYVTTQQNCTWTTTNNGNSWIEINPSSHTGSGTVIITVTENRAKYLGRNGKINIAGHEFTINQNGGDCNPITTFSNQLNFNSEGGDSVGFVETDFADCPWSSTNNGNGWIEINPSSHTGSGSVTIIVAENNTNREGRNGIINIAEHQITINQSGADCNPITTFSNQLTFNSEGGDSVGSVETDFEDCPWTSTNNGYEWITIIPDSGTGSNNNVHIKVDPDTTKHNGRDANIVIAKQTIEIIQNGDSCSFSVSEDTLTFSASAGTQTINLNASFEDCDWSSSNNDHDWVTIQTEGEEEGDKEINIQVTENNTGEERTGTITIAGIEIVIIQYHH